MTCNIQFVPASMGYGHVGNYDVDDTDGLLFQEE